MAATTPAIDVYEHPYEQHHEQPRITVSWWHSIDDSKQVTLNVSNVAYGIVEPAIPLLGEIPIDVRNELSNHGYRLIDQEQEQDREQPSDTTQ